MNDNYYKTPLGIYFNHLLDLIIREGKLKEEQGLILDFGCGLGYLKKKLPYKNIVNYDIKPELSDIKHFTEVKPDVVVMNNVLEHMDKREIEETIILLRRINQNMKIIVALPYEEFVSKVANFILKDILNSRDIHKGHITRYFDVNRILSRYAYCIKTINLMTITQIKIWRYF